MDHESSNLDNSVFEDAAPRAMFDEDQEQHEPPPMHRSKSSLGAQSRGTFFIFAPPFAFVFAFPPSFSLYITGSVIEFPCGGQQKIFLIILEVFYDGQFSLPLGLFLIFTTHSFSLPL